MANKKKSPEEIITDVIKDKDFEKLEKNYKILKSHKPKGLFLAIAEKNFNKVEELIDQGSSLEDTFLGGNLLHFAIFEYCENTKNSKEEKSLLKIIEYLLVKGVNLNKTTPDGLTPLILALDYKKMEIVELLIKNGAKNEYDYILFNKSYRELFRAIKITSYKKVEHLIESENVSLESSVQGYTPLLFALLQRLMTDGVEQSLKRNEELKKIIEFLVKKNANVEAQLPCGTTSTHLADFISDQSIKDLLIKRGAKNSFYSILEKDLIAAIGKFDMNRVREVVSKGVSLDFNYFGQSLMTLAVSYVPYLEGSDVYSESLLKLHEVIEFLIKEGVSVEESLPCKTSAFHLADLKGDERLKSILLNAGAKNEVFSEDAKKLYWAIRKVDLNTVKEIVNGIESLEEHILGFTPLLLTVDEAINLHPANKDLYPKIKEIIEYLILKGADVNACIKPCKTSVLKLSTLDMNSVDIQKLLVKSGALIPKL